MGRSDTSTGARALLSWVVITEEDAKAASLDIAALRRDIDALHRDIDALHGTGGS